MAGADSKLNGYPMKIDSEGSLTCDMSKLEDHLIQQQNYRQGDVANLTVFLTNQTIETQDFWLTDIRILTNDHSVFYI